MGGEKPVVAKLIVSPGTLASANVKSNLEDFYDYQVSILDSPELKAAAQDAASKVVAGAERMPINVQIARIKGSEVLNVITRSASPEYAIAYSEALIATYIHKVQGNRPNNPNEAAEPPLKGDLEAVQRRIKRLQSAEGFYRAELDFIGRSSLDMEVTRRKYPQSPPSDMPEEFVRVLSLQLTPNEQAYLNALTKADPVAAEATRGQAEHDRKIRLESLGKQLQTVVELIRDQQKRIENLEILIRQNSSLEKDVAKTRADYDKLHGDEAQKANDPLLKGSVPDVVVNVIQKPVVMGAAP